MFSVPSSADQWKHTHKKTLPKFSTSYEGIVNIFYFFYKIIEEKGNIRSACVEFSLFHKTFSSCNLETASHISHVFFVLIAIKTQFLTNQTDVPNYIFYKKLLKQSPGWRSRALNQYYTVRLKKSNNNNMNP